MKILVDTNVLLDILQRREPFFTDSYMALKKALERNDMCCVSASAVTDIYYILRKGLQDDQAARLGLSRVLQLVDVADVQALDIQTALESGMPDFEDAVVAAVALRINADCILTRNLMDFTLSPIAAVSPHDFLEA